MITGIAPQSRTTFNGAVKFAPNTRGLEHFRQLNGNKAKRVLSDETGTSFHFRSVKKQRSFTEQAKQWLFTFAENTKPRINEEEFKNFHKFTNVNVG